MTKVWNGYEYIYRPQSVKPPGHYTDLVDESAVKRQFQEEWFANYDQKNPRAKRLLHHAKQNGYVNRWFDAANATHPSVDPMIAAQMAPVV